MTVITDPNDIHLFQLQTMRTMLALEIQGIGRGGMSMAQIIRNRWGIKKRRRLDVYFDFCRLANLEPSQHMCELKADLSAKKKNTP